MGRKCSVKNCTSSKDKAKVSLFKAPENDQERTEWSNRLGTYLTLSSLVCERHFDPTSVKTERQFTDPCNVTHKESLLKKKLYPGARPLNQITADQLHRRHVLNIMGQYQQLPRNILSSSKVKITNELQEASHESSKENCSYLSNVDKKLPQGNLHQSQQASTTEEFSKNNVSKDMDADISAGADGCTSKECISGVGKSTDSMDIDISSGVDEHISKESICPVEKSIEILDVQFSSDVDKHISSDSTSSVGNNIESNTEEGHSSTSNKPVPTNTEPSCQESDLYLKLIAEHDNLDYPPQWTFTHCVDKNILMFTLLDAFPSPTADSKNVVPVFSKQIIVHKNSNIQIRLFDKNVAVGEREGQLETIVEFQDLLKRVNESAACRGGPYIREFTKVCPENAFKDRGVWRHNKCPLLLSGPGVCQYCHSLAKTFAQNLDRQVKNKQRIRLKKRHLSPELQKKIAHAMKKRKLTQARLTRREKKLVAARKELADVHGELQKLKKSTLDKELKKHPNIPENQVTLIQECFAAGKVNNPKARRYSDEWILLCLLLYIRSSATYNMLRRNNILPLPTKSTITRYLKSSNVDCGFDENFFKLFEEELKIQPEIARNDILSFDEISVRTSLEVNTKSMTFDGLTNYGKDSDLNSQSLNEKADHGLVFMFSSLAGNFHQPVAMFASKGVTKGNVLAALVLMAIINIEKAGGKVQGIVCDGATTNRNMWEELGISGSLKDCRCSFENPFDESRKVYAFSDAPHLIKCIRNRLESKRVLKVNGEEVKWSYYESLYREDSKSILRVCPKLTERHVNVPDSMKMRVSLAVQVFSNSVAAGLKLYQRQEEKEEREVKQFEECEATIDFTIQINSLFDVMNRSHKKEGIRKDSPDFEVLEEGIKWLDDWERNAESKDDFLTKSTAEGLRVTLHSTLELTKYLLDKCGFEYVLTSKMNQDCLEQFFGCIRQAGCQNDHPTMHTFKQLYHLLSIYQIIKPPKYGNCTVREDGTEQER